MNLKEETKPSLDFDFKSNLICFNSISFHPLLLNKLIVGGSNGKILYLKNIKEKEKQQLSSNYLFHGHSGQVNETSFTKDGDLFFSASSDSTIKIWVSSLSRSQTRQWKAHFHPVNSLSIDPEDCSRILSASNDKTIKLWSINRLNFSKNPPFKFKKAPQTFIQSYKGHTNWVRSVRFNSDGRIFCSAADDKTSLIFDPRVKVSIGKIIPTFNETPLQADFVPKANHYLGICTDKGNFYLYDLRSFKCVQYFDAIHNGTANNFAFHPSGNFAITVGNDKNIKILDLIEGRQVFNLMAHKSPIFGVGFSSEGDKFATGGKDGQIFIWNFNLKSTEEEGRVDPSKKVKCSPFSSILDFKSSTPISSNTSYDCTLFNKIF